MITTASLVKEHRKSKKKMKDDDEIDSLLGEIPRAISFNLSLKQGCTNDHHDQERSGIMYSDSSNGALSHNSPVSGFSLQSDGSSSSLFSSNGHSLSDHGSPTTPPIEELRPHVPVWMDSFGNKDAIDDLGLSKDLSGMYISEQPQIYGTLGFDFDRFSRNLSDCERYQLNGGNNAVNPQFFYPRRQPAGHQYMAFPVSSIPRPDFMAETSPYVRQTEARINVQNYGFHVLSVPNSVMHFHQQIENACRMLPSHLKLGQRSLERENLESFKLHSSFSLPPKCNSLAEARGYVYCLAKDQHGCRFLQRMFDEGTARDVRIIFNEVIDHVVELMMNPFGNYLMQKLLEVCNEDQRMQILLRVTAKPGELIRISLNTHGTRVVQKLIETLKARQQISLVITALEPGFLALIKDLNGNHVVQRCLQCLSHEDSKFIFHAAAKYCVDIATHQHGCCVLQRCITHSDGEHRDRLIAEISANALQLAQDAFGNYVVQFILELKMSSATNKLVSEFEGNYVYLSTQKFSSHVVEKCLMTCYNNVRSNIIHELLTSNHFEHLLQDPHANYVVQTALKVCEGPLHNILVDAIESHKAMSRSSPYSKRIFSHKLLKK